MKVWSCEQGSREWLALRAGKPTASEFHRILTPTGKPSSQAEGYMCRLIAEYFLGMPLDQEETKWMQRGTLLETEAVAAYEFQNGVDTEKVGFVTDEENTLGCSPDRFVGEDSGLEIKVPAPNTHIYYMIHGVLKDDHKPQLQGCLYVTGRKYWDVVSYHPDFPRVITRVLRDEPYIEKLAIALKTFVFEQQRLIAILTEKYGDFRKKPETSEDFITDADVDLILQAQREARIS